MTKRQNFGVKAGLMIGIAFFIARLSLAKTQRDFMLASGSTMVEIALVLFLERKTRDMQPKLDRWHKEQFDQRKAKNALDAGTNELSARVQALNATGAERRQLDWDSEQDAMLCDEQKLIQVAIGASDGGYAAGLVERRKRLHDLPPNSEENDPDSPDENDVDEQKGAE